jgi:hypothetical protein
MDPLSWVRKQVEEADTDLLRGMVRLSCERVMSEEVDAICGAPRRAVRRPDEPPQRLPHQDLGHPDRHDRSRRPEATRGVPTSPTGLSTDLTSLPAAARGMDDWGRDRELIDALAEAGASWWIEYVHPAIDLDATREAVSRGPLR